MGTPIRQILKTKVVSPLSPSLRYNKIKPQYVKSYKISTTNSPSLVRRLNFDSFNVSNSIRKVSNLKHIESSFNENNKIKVQITDYSDNVLLIDSPVKRNLLKHGVSDRLSHLHVLGKGTFGVVVRGIYKGTSVAAKVVKLSKNGRFLRESNALHLKHANVINVLNVICDNSSKYGIVLMEYIGPFQHLQNILNNESVILNQNVITKYAIDVCEGLKYCHKNKILHLDVKPKNILVNQFETCKLSDFGNSVHIDKASIWNGQHGTVAYAAPELLCGRSPTEKCDVYSLGILLWQMRYRESPYIQDDNFETIIYKVIKYNYRPSKCFVTISDEYSQIYTSCWESNARDRPDVDYVLLRLHKLL